MFSGLNTKLLVVIVALLATIVAYLGYERHKEQVAERQRQEFLRKRTAQEKKYVDGALTDWGKSAAAQNKK
jgi:alpha-D-ribose 1-methylphosphonate 5-triphosphate diphosphatase PhnM